MQGEDEQREVDGRQEIGKEGRVREGEQERNEAGRLVREKLEGVEVRLEQEIEPGIVESMNP